MAINEWWAGDPEQRFWMELTDRDDLGDDLRAPTTDGEGNSYWGYELLRYVRPGDVVLHWHKTLLSESGIVGWSQASGSWEGSQMYWRAQGTGPGSLITTLRPAWRIPLSDYRPLPHPVSLTDVRAVESELRTVLSDLQSSFSKSSLYFPFSFSAKRQLRATQTYFTKMPREVTKVLGIDSLGQSLGPSSATTGPSTESAGSGYMTDSAVRSAIEWRAVRLAQEAYDREGFRTAYVGGTEPYDLVATRGTEVRRVEVKGSSGSAVSVELTSGEVKNSNAFSPTDLFVVDKITWWREADGSVGTDGGDVRHWRDWRAHESALEVTRYRYTLPQ